MPRQQLSTARKNRMAKGALLRNASTPTNLINRTVFDYQPASKW